MQWNYLLQDTHLGRWASSGMVGFQLKNTEVLPNVEEEIYPKALLIAATTRGNASIQHPKVSDPAWTALGLRAAPRFLETGRLGWDGTVQIKGKRELRV